MVRIVHMTNFYQLGTRGLDFTPPPTPPPPPHQPGTFFVRPVGPCRRKFRARKGRTFVRQWEPCLNRQPEGSLWKQTLRGWVVSFRIWRVFFSNWYRWESWSCLDPTILLAILTMRLNFILLLTVRLPYTFRKKRLYTDSTVWGLTLKRFSSLRRYSLCWAFLSTKSTFSVKDNFWSSVCQGTWMHYFSFLLTQVDCFWCAARSASATH